MVAGDQLATSRGLGGRHVRKLTSRRMSHIQIVYVYSLCKSSRSSFPKSPPGGGHDVYFGSPRLFRTVFSDVTTILSFSSMCPVVTVRVVKDLDMKYL